MRKKADTDEVSATAAEEMPVSEKKPAAKRTVRKAAVTETESETSDDKPVKKTVKRTAKTASKVPSELAEQTVSEPEPSQDQALPESDPVKSTENRPQLPTGPSNENIYSDNTVRRTAAPRTRTAEPRPRQPQRNYNSSPRNNYDAQPRQNSDYRGYQNPESRTLNYQSSRNYAERNTDGSYIAVDSAGGYKSQAYSSSNTNYNEFPPSNASDAASGGYGYTQQSYYPQPNYSPQTSQDVARNLHELDSHEKAEGILEVMPDGFGFIRSNGYLPGEDDIYVAPSQIKRFNLKTGDYITGNKRVKGPAEKFSAILFIEKINGITAEAHSNIVPFESLTPVFPHERLHLETVGSEISMRITDLLSPVGKGQRGMIVAQPKVGKTTLLKQIARALLVNHPELHIIILLIDERPEEVTDMQESIVGDNVEIVYSTFDEMPEHHKRVSEMVIDRAKRLVEMHRDVVILLDSITRLTRAYNLTVTPSGRTLSGGLDPAALYMPKRFFGAARCMREGGSLTILATALLETGSRLDDMVYEEFKGTGNMELVLNRNLSERRIFPAIDILKSSTRRDDLLLTQEESDAVTKIRRVTTLGMKQEESMEQILNLFASTKDNSEFMQKLKYVVF